MLKASVIGPKSQPAAILVNEMGLVLRKFIVTLTKPDAPEFGSREHIPWNTNMMNVAEEVTRQKINRLSTEVISDKKWEIDYNSDSQERLHLSIEMTDEFYEFGGKSKDQETQRFPKPAKPKFK